MKENTVLALIGLPLTGKTTLGYLLSRRTGTFYLDIDKAAQCAPPQEENPYRSDEARARERKRMTVAYSVLHAAITAHLQAGWPIIISATYSRRSNQELLRQAVQAGAGELKIVWCSFNDTDEEITRRVNERLTTGAIGGCRSVSHYLDDRKQYEGTDLPHVKIDTSESLEANIRKILVYIGE